MEEEKRLEEYDKNTKYDYELIPEQSANTFFHFMKKIDYLKEILEDRYLYARYCSCSDDFSILGIPELTESFVAMKCFCDIPLHTIKKHVDYYGFFGIGFSKEWGIKKGLQPVIYCNENSLYSKSIKTSYENFNNLKKDEINSEKINDMAENLNQSLKFFKPIKKYNSDTGKVEKYYTDEQEWRFVPNIKDEKYLKEAFSYDFLFDEDKLNYYCNMLKEKKYGIEFEYSEIKYILVKNGNDKDQLMDFIMNLKNLSNDIKYNLLSKILVWDECKGDF